MRRTMRENMSKHLFLNSERGRLPGQVWYDDLRASDNGLRDHDGGSFKMRPGSRSFNTKLSKM